MSERMIPASEVYGELIRQASNLKRYPYESATMNEAASMAANAIRRIAEGFKQ